MSQVQAMAAGKFSSTEKLSSKLTGADRSLIRSQPPRSSPTFVSPHLSFPAVGFHVKTQLQICPALTKAVK